MRIGNKGDDTLTARRRERGSVTRTRRSKPLTAHALSPPLGTIDARSTSCVRLRDQHQNQQLPLLPPSLLSDDDDADAAVAVP